MITVPPTRAANANPNAPRIEYFRTNVQAVAPGGSLTLFWSTRNVASAAIYQLDQNGQPSLVINVEADGNQNVTVNSRLRGEARFVLAIGEGVNRVEESLTLPITCPVAWFFQPAPSDCPNEEANQTVLVEQVFERGRMIYIVDSNRLYVLFNDGRDPRWASYENRYDPAIHPERDEAFDSALSGTGFVQAVGRLGFLWRGNDVVRSRLGNATAPEITFDGFVQTARTAGSTSGADSLFINSSTGTVLQLLPQGASWQIITPG